MNERVHQIYEILHEIQRSSIRPFRLPDNAHMMEDFFPGGSSSKGILFDQHKSLEWLNKVFQMHINNLESDLLENGEPNFCPPPRPPFFSVRPMEDRLGERIDSKDSSGSSRSRQPGLMSWDKGSTPQSSVVSSIVVLERVSENGTSKATYLERVRDPDLKESYGNSRAQEPVS